LNDDKLAHLLAQVAVEAGGPIMAVRARGFSASYKADSSPVTEADLAAEALIVERLAALLPDLPVVAEECVASGRAPEIQDRFVLVDPLDGTREFVAGRDEFTVNLALVANGVPVAGAIYAPALGRLWYGGERSFAAAEVAPGAVLDIDRARPITVRRTPPCGPVALVSLSHLDPKTQAYLDREGITERRRIGSSVKFGMIAEGEADLYPRLSATCEWDTAAGHAILRAAGGDVTAPDGGALRYGKREQRFLHDGFIAWGGLRPGPLREAPG
jgi:3'(2'),5'-bisphosphate nucleotidase